MKLPNLENWSSGELSKSAKIWLSKLIFYVKNHLNVSHFFSLKNTNLGAHFLLLTFFDNVNFLNPFIFYTDIQFLTARHYSNSQNSISSID